MDEKILKQIQQGIKTAFIDSGSSSNLAYKPQFISNNFKEGRKVLATIEEELLRCDQFSISVAFITMGGITPLLQTLKELEERNIPGRILTTDYLDFSEPKALEKLAALHNIELKMFYSKEAREGFHTKGYIFKEEELYDDLIYDDKVGEIFYIENGEKYFESGKLNRKKIQGEIGDFVDFI